MACETLETLYRDGVVLVLTNIEFSVMSHSTCLPFYSLNTICRKNIHAFIDC